MVIDISRSLSNSALSLQVRASRTDLLSLRVKNSDLITIVAFVAKHKLVSVIAMCADCHPIYSTKHDQDHRPDLLPDELREDLVPIS